MASDVNDLPLFGWTPDCVVLAFPLDRRTAKVRDVAQKARTKRTDIHLEQYRSQVTSALLKQLRQLGLTQSQRDAQISSFWLAVEREITRISYRGSAGNNPKGAA